MPRPQVVRKDYTDPDQSEARISMTSRLICIWNPGFWLVGVCIALPGVILTVHRFLIGRGLYGPLFGEFWPDPVSDWPNALRPSSSYFSKNLRPSSHSPPSPPTYNLTLNRTQEMSLTSFSFLYVWWLLKEPLGSIICSVVAVGRRSLHVSSLSSSSSSVHLLSHGLSFSSYRTFKKLVPHRVVTFGKLKPHHARHISFFFDCKRVYWRRRNPSSLFIVFFLWRHIFASSRLDLFSSVENLRAQFKNLQGRAIS